jgi:hypothetical protein
VQLYVDAVSALPITRTYRDAMAISRGVPGLTAITVWIACPLVIRNQRILTAYDTQQQDDARRAAAGLPPRTRKRRRTSLAQIAAAPP